MATTTPPRIRAPAGDTEADDGHHRPVSPMSQLMGSARAALKNTPSIYAVMRLEGRASAQFVKENILQRLVDKYPRLSCHIEFRPEDGTTYFKRLPTLPLDQMLSEHTLPGADCDAALTAYVSKIISEWPQPYGDLPPWDAHVLHYEADPERTEFVLRADHTMGDGMAYNQMLYCVLDPVEGGADAGATPPAAAAGTTADGGAAGPAQPRDKAAAGKATVKQVPRAFTLPRPLRMLRLALDVVTVFVQRWDRPTPMKAQGDEAGTPRTWGRVQLDLDQMRAVAAALPQRCTMNDLLVSIWSGGVNRYIKAKGATPPPQLRMTTFISTRPVEPHPLTRHLFRGTNDFTFICARVPTGDVHPAVRTQQCSTVLADLRGSFAVGLSIALPKLLRALLPSARKGDAVSIIIDHICIKSTLCLSNVRGPRTRMAVGGLEVAELYGIIDPFAWGSVGLAFSYDGKVTLTASGYASRVPDPQRLLSCVVEEFEALRESVLG